MLVLELIAFHLYPKGIFSGLGFDLRGLIKPVNEWIVRLLGASLQEPREIPVNLNHSLLTLSSLLRPPHLDFCHRFSEVIFVDGIDDCKQKVSLDVLLAILSQIKEKTHNLPVTLNLLQNTFDNQFWAHRDPNHVNLFLKEVLLLSAQNFP